MDHPNGIRTLTRGMGIRTVHIRRSEPRSWQSPNGPNGHPNGHIGHKIVIKFGESERCHTTPDLRKRMIKRNPNGKSERSRSDSLPVWGRGPVGEGPPPPGGTYGCSRVDQERENKIMTANTDKITIPDRGTDPDDTCAAVIDREDAAERCLIEADALPDGAPEQISVLLRGLLASQLAMLRMMVSITEKLDAWPHFATCGDPGFTCLDRTCRDCYPIAR
jgi:hypothetical protein